MSAPVVFFDTDPDRTMDDIIRLISHTSEKFEESKARAVHGKDWYPLCLGCFDVNLTVIKEFLAGASKDVWDMIPGMINVVSNHNRPMTILLDVEGSITHNDTVSTHDCPGGLTQCFQMLQGARHGRAHQSRASSFGTRDSPSRKMADIIWHEMYKSMNTQMRFQHPKQETVGLMSDPAAPIMNTDGTAETPASRWIADAARLLQALELDKDSFELHLRVDVLVEYVEKDHPNWHIRADDQTSCPDCSEMIALALNMLSHHWDHTEAQDGNSRYQILGP